MNNRHYQSFRIAVEDLLKSCKKAYLGPYQKDLDVTIGVTSTDKGFIWNYQTGDNSFTGGAYGHSHWVVLYLTRRSNCKELSRDAVLQLQELLA